MTNTVNCKVKFTDLIKESDHNLCTPSKKLDSDVGYDFFLLKKHKVLYSENDKEITVMYDTGIQLEIPETHYVEILPRSSITKTGYMLTNSVGIIDPSYRGNLYVVLTKVSPNVPDLQLPIKCCQLILKERLNATFTPATDLNETIRGEGGFGSTDANYRNS